MKTMQTWFAVFDERELVALFKDEEHAKLWKWSEPDPKRCSIARRRIVLATGLPLMDEISSAPAEVSKQPPDAGASEANHKGSEP
jgi:hypothetical protein